MNITQYKINNYAEGVSDLPDYPSDSGYTAERLKAIFDSRSDNEIKEKHNALIDELSEILAEQESKLASTNADISAAVNEHNGDANAHANLFKAISDRFEDYTTREIFDFLLEDKVDKITGKGLSSNDYTDEEKAELETMATSFPELVKKSDLSEAYVAKSHSCDVADAALNAQRADNAIADSDGNIIHETYVTKNELPEASVFYAEWSNFADASNKAYCDENGNSIPETYVTKKELNFTLQEVCAPYDNDIGIINAEIGDISEALDSILAMQASYIGGETE